MHNENTANWIYQAEGDIARIEACFSSAAFSPHRHDTYTVGVTLQGVQCFDYRGATRNSLPGNLVILHPDELHDGRAGDDAGFRYRTIYIEPSSIQSVLNGKALPFVQDGMSSDARLSRAVLPLLEDLERPLAALEYQDAIYDLATALDQVAGCKTPAPVSNYSAAEAARQIIEARLDEGVTLEELESMTGHDRWELSRDFRALFGTSPYRYLTMRRLDKARDMLLAGDELADVAVACAFSDQSHFTRHFKKAWGMTPGRWTKVYHH